MYMLLMILHQNGMLDASDEVPLEAQTRRFWSITVYKYIARAYEWTGRQEITASYTRQCYYRQVFGVHIMREHACHHLKKTTMR